MIELFKGYLDKEWHTKTECLEWYEKQYFTKLNEREFRRRIESFNEKYAGGETEMFVAHSKKGYLLTNDIDIIKKSLLDDYRRALKLLKRNSRCTKALSEKNQISLGQNEADLYEVVMKMGA